MNYLLLNLRVAGGLLIALAFAHEPIARRFDWRGESARLSPFNRQVLLVHAFFIALTVGLMGALALFWAEELTSRTPLAGPLCAGLTVFWAARLLIQLFVYDAALWRGKRFETAAHIAFTTFWLYLVIVFAWCWSRQHLQVSGL
ncbi:MAG TPA: hypothetical protein VN915_16745 [Elusimicrobiota bacterium]|nr:hypothetical protein [Elusimicrobiota bacterium]